jgi:hypothetical protein
MDPGWSQPGHVPASAALQASGEGGGGDLELEAGSARALASHHDAAAAALSGISDDVPALDGGLADPELLTILSLVLSTVGELSLVNTLGATTVRAVEEHLLGVDGMVAAAYDSVDPDRFDGLHPLIPPGTLHHPFPPGWGP